MCPGGPTGAKLDTWVLQYFLILDERPRVTSVTISSQDADSFRGKVNVVPQTYAFRFEYPIGTILVEKLMTN